MNSRMLSSRRPERGEGRLRALVYTVILVVGVFIAVKIVPAYVADYQLKDKIGEQARFAVVNRYSQDQIKDNIFRVIRDLDIPAQRDDVKVQDTNHGLMISVSYTVPVDFWVYQTDLKFNTSSEGRDIMK